MLKKFIQKNELKNISFLIFLTLISASMLITSQTAHAQTQRSYVGSYADGYEAGKKAADGGSSKCPSGNSITYCIGYHIGFGLKQGAHDLGRLLLGFK